MPRAHHLAAVAALVLAGGVHAATPAAAPDAAVRAAVAAPTRSDADRARDRYRHPAETLAFFGVTPTKKVVEFSPGGGWYSAILAPLPRGAGSYTALAGSAKAADGARAMLQAKGLTATVATLDAAAGTSTIAAGSQDIVLTFRNIHNLTMNGGDAGAAGAFRAWFAMLRPGGTLGIVEHRLPESASADAERKSGYLKVSTVRRFAEGAGFRYAGASEVNANPRDTHDHPAGVWTLPPTLQLGEQDRARYLAIGESDRMTLRFVKPR